MVIVTGTATIRPDALDRAIAVSLEHVRRSRAEPGCIEHGVHQRADDPLTLFFFERWADQDAISAHFKVPESREFVTALGALTTKPPSMTIYDATPRP